MRTFLSPTVLIAFQQINFYYNKYSMESEGQQLRIEVCEKCYEHELVESHSQLQFEEATAEIKTICVQLGLKMKRNRPYKYMRKLKDSKISSKRYLDTNTNKIVQFPRRSAFQVYYLNVLVYSRIRLMDFPNYILLKHIIKRLKDLYRRDPLLKGLGIFRDIQMEWESLSNKIQCLYDYVLKFLSSDQSETSVGQAFNRIIAQKYDSELLKKKIILPYSHYIGKEKQQKMSSIYCPTTKVQSIKTHKSTQSKIGLYLGSQRQKSAHPFREKLSERSSKENNLRLFDLAKKSCKALGSAQLTFPLNDRNLNSFESQMKKIYFSYLDVIKQNRKRNIKTANSQRSLKKEKNRLPSALPQKRLPKKTSNSSPKLQTVRKKQEKKSELLRSSQNSGDNVTVIIHPSEHPEGDSLTEKKMSQSFRSENQNAQIKQNQKIVIRADEEDLIDLKKSDGQKLRSYESLDELKKQASVLQLKCSKKSSKNQSVVLNQSGIQRSHSYFNGKQALKRSWEKYESINRKRIPALIVSLFSEPQRFEIELTNSTLQGESRDKYEEQMVFNIAGEELIQQFETVSLRDMFEPTEIKLFPEKLRKIQCISPYSSRTFIGILNLLISNNQEIITRIFQNKRYLSTSGIYCIWLKNLQGAYQPIFIDDAFAVFRKEKQGDNQQFYGISDLVYGRPCYEYSVWFMILEKAVAKVLGSYHRLNSCSISLLMNILIGFPTVDFSHLSLEKVGKTFEDKIFLNKAAKFYVKKVQGQDSQHPSIHQVLKFEKNQNRPKQSVIFVNQQTTIKKYPIHQFLHLFSELTLSFYHPNYFLNQISLTRVPTQQVRESFSMKIKSLAVRNNCYFNFSFGGLSMKNSCKVLIYRFIQEQQEKGGKQNGSQSHLSERNMYEYVGQIERFGDFFFENELQVGEYICIIQGSFMKDGNSRGPHLTVFSEKPLSIQQNKSSYEAKKHHRIHEKKKKSVPKLLVETTNQFGYNNQVSGISEKGSRLKKRPNFKIRRQFMADRDSTNSEKQNLAQ